MTQAPAISLSVASAIPSALQLTITQGIPEAPNDGLYYARHNQSWAAIPDTAGTVTSVGLALPSSLFSVSGSPVTSSGTLTGALQAQAAASFLAGPVSGSAAAPTMRGIAGTDLTTALATPPAIGGTTPAAAAFTTVSVTGQITSTLAIGTAPFAVTSTTLVPNLYVARAALADSATVGGNLTGPITSVGNATALAAQTGTGTTFVVQTSPSLITPALGVATATSLATPIISTTANLTVTDATNSWNPLVYTAGISSAGYWTFPGTLAASSSMVGAVVFSGGIAVAATSYFGSSVNIANAGATASVNVTGTGQSAQVIINGDTGDLAQVGFQISGTPTTAMISKASVGAWYLHDNVNTTNPIIYTAGAIGAGYTTFGNTLAASSSTVGSVVFSGGIAVTATSYFGGSVNIAGATAVTGGQISMGYTRAPYSSGGTINIYGTTTTGAFIANGLMIQMGNTSTAGGGFYVSTSTGSALVPLINYAISGFTFSDGTNTWNPIVYTGGAVGAGYVTFAGTLASSSVSTGAVVISGGLAAGGSFYVSATGWYQTSTSSATNCIINGTTGHAANLNFYLNGANKFTIGITGGSATNPYNLYDVANTITVCQYTAGAISAAYFTWGGTLDATNSTTAANVFSGGVAIAKSLNVGTTGTFGGIVTLAPAAGNNARLQLSAPTGQNCNLQLSVNGTAQASWICGTTYGIQIYDSINSWDTLDYTYGATSAGYYTFHGTLAGSNATTASVVFSGGIAVAKTSYFGGNVDLTDGNNLGFGTTTGTKIGTATSQKIGFFNVTPVVQPASPGGYATVITAGSTNTWYTNTSSSGGIGSTAYTFGDVVIALKNLGLIAA